MARILTVESDHRLQRTIGRALHRQGHEVHQTGTGASALRMAAERRFDVAVVSDVLGGQSVPADPTSSRPMRLTATETRRTQTRTACATQTNQEDYIMLLPRQKTPDLTLPTLDHGTFDLSQESSERGTVI